MPFREVIASEEISAVSPTERPAEEEDMGEAGSLAEESATPSRKESVTAAPAAGFPMT